MAITFTEPTAQITDNTDATSYALAEFTPDANAILLLWAITPGSVVQGTVAGGSLTWNFADSQLSDGNATLTRLFWAKTGASPAACTATFDCTGDQATGGMLCILSAAGANVNLSSPIRQTGKSFGAPSTNPTASFAISPDAGNGMAIVWGINRTAPDATPPADWTEFCDTGMTLPNAGICGAFRNSGETSTTPTFTAATNQWGSVGVELWVAGAGGVPGGGGSTLIGLRSGLVGRGRTIG